MPKPTYTIGYTPGPNTPQPAFIPGGGLIPPGGGGGGSGYRRSKSWVNINPVGADIMGKFRGESIQQALPKFGFNGPKFRMPKFF